MTKKKSYGDEWELLIKVLLEIFFNEIKDSKQTINLWKSKLLLTNFQYKWVPKKWLQPCDKRFELNLNNPELWRNYTFQFLVESKMYFSDNSSEEKLLDNLHSISSINFWKEIDESIWSLYFIFRPAEPPIWTSNKKVKNEIDNIVENNNQFPDHWEEISINDKYFDIKKLESFFKKIVNNWTNNLESEYYNFISLELLNKKDFIEKIIIFIERSLKKTHSNPHRKKQLLEEYKDNEVSTDYECSNIDKIDDILIGAPDDDKKYATNKLKKYNCSKFRYLDCPIVMESITSIENTVKEEVEDFNWEYQNLRSDFFNRTNGYFLSLKEEEEVKNFILSSQWKGIWLIFYIWTDGVYKITYSDYSKFQFKSIK